MAGKIIVYCVVYDKMKDYWNLVLLFVVVVTAATTFQDLLVIILYSTNIIAFFSCLLQIPLWFSSGSGFSQHNIVNNTWDLLRNCFFMILSFVFYFFYFFWMWDNPKDIVLFLFLVKMYEVVLSRAKQSFFCIRSYES